MPIIREYDYTALWATKVNGAENLQDSGRIYREPGLMSMPTDD